MTADHCGYHISAGKPGQKCCAFLKVDPLYHRHDAAGAKQDKHNRQHVLLHPGCIEALDVSSTVRAPETAIVTYCHSTARCTCLHLLSSIVPIKQAMHAWLEGSSPYLKSHMASNDGKQ